MSSKFKPLFIKKKKKKKGRGSRVFFLVCPDYLLLFPKQKAPAGPEYHASPSAKQWVRRENRLVEREEGVALWRQSAGEGEVVVVVRGGER